MSESNNPFLEKYIKDIKWWHKIFLIFHRTYICKDCIDTNYYIKVKKAFGRIFVIGEGGYSDTY